jgi:hypothetical protein
MTLNSLVSCDLKGIIMCQTTICDMIRVLCISTEYVTDVEILICTENLYMHVCVCVCVCVKKTALEGEVFHI